jgi:hypothetical protein
MGLMIVIVDNDLCSKDHRDRSKENDVTTNDDVSVIKSRVEVSLVSYGSDSVKYLADSSPPLPVVCSQGLAAVAVL